MSIFKFSESFSDKSKAVSDKAKYAGCFLFFLTCLFLTVSSCPGHAQINTSEKSVTANVNKADFDAAKRDWSFKGDINQCHESDTFFYVYSTGGPKEEVRGLKKYVTQMAEKAKKENTKDKISVLADKDFSDDMWGRGVVYLIGPFKYHMLMKKYFKNTIFTIEDSAVLAPVNEKENYFKNTGRECFIIFHWPQPNGKGQAVLYTGPDYKNVKEIFNQHHGLTDFVVSGPFFRNMGAALAFSVTGFYDKKSVPWKYNEKRSAFTFEGRDFFTRELKWDFDRERLAKAAERNIVLKDGRKIEGSLFAIDKMRILIRYTEKGETRYLIRPLSEIETVDNSKSVLSAVYKPRTSGYTQMTNTELYLEPEPFLISTGPGIRTNNSGKVLKDNYFCSTPPLLNVKDMFGQTLEVESTYDEEDYRHDHRAKYRIPVEPGGTIITASTFQYKWKPRVSKEGNCIYSFNHFPGPRTKYRLNLTVPSGNVLKVSPEPVEVIKSSDKTRIKIERDIEPGEGVYVDVEFEKKAHSKNKKH